MDVALEINPAIANIMSAHGYSVDDATKFLCGAAHHDQERTAEDILIKTIKEQKTNFYNKDSSKKLIEEVVESHPNPKIRENAISFGKAENVKADEEMIKAIIEKNKRQHELN